MNETPIETQAVVVREQVQAVERANLSIDELREQLAFIRQVMAREMKEGQDYGKIPGCGDKPGLFQPGAQKLLLTFQLTPHVKKEVLRELPHPSIFGHREYEFTISVRSKTGREWDGVGTCSTFESKYRYRKSSRKCPQCGKESIRKDKKPNGGWYCWSKLGGCGAQFGTQDTAITEQEEGKSDNENPAEFWNTVRKMAFKRAIVHASINATNTSELWSQDLEDLPQARMSDKEEYFDKEASDDLSFENAPQRATAPKPPQDTTSATKTPPAGSQAHGKATDKHRLKALNNLLAAPGQANVALVEGYLRSKLWIRGEQTVMDFPLEFVPTTKDEMEALAEAVERFETQQREQDIVLENREVEP